MANSQVSKINNVSTEAVEKATGKGWSEWIEIIDELGGSNLSHKDIAKLLFDKNLIENQWWCQQVTVGYEYAKNRRITGETESTGFQIGVQKTLNASAKDIWNVVFSSQGLHIWLGEISSLLLKKNSKYSTNNGTSGEIRTVDEGKRIRLTWQPKKRSGKPTTLQLYFEDKGENKSSLKFHQEHLKNNDEREEMKKHWSQALKEIEKLF